ncbi:snare protein, putative [Leishmania tarentolae]|uniref:Snare protein, putative n=1 Tax=Leishmania tarentolae TaxID=5689 RepID=A0A640KFX5_LEITA|nr:snare protein, putative [Leishmania tarentolae]
MAAAAANAISTVEEELRRAKDTLKTLSTLAEQAERGAMVDYNLAQRLTQEVSDLVQPLVQGTMNSFGGSTVVSSSGATLHARAVSSGCSHAVTPLQRRRAEQVLSEVKLIETSLYRYAKKAEQQATYVSNLKSLVGNGAGAYRENYEAMDHLERERKSLQYARQRMQAMESESRDVLAALQDQGRRLGGVGSKLGNMLETLGVSNMTILQIVRRNKADAWLVYGGIALLLFLLWYIW